MKASGEWIGILGASGKVGKHLVGQLRADYCLRCGGRSARADGFKNYGDTMGDGQNIEAVRVDIGQDVELEQFCSGCQVVINCAGPSLRFGARVAGYAARAGAVYIDAFGSDTVRRQLMESGMAGQGVYVLSAGAFPGFAEILPLYVASRVERVSGLEIIAGNKEAIGFAGGMDFILSVRNACGIPMGEIGDGRLRIGTEEESRELVVPGIRERLRIHKYMYPELLSLSARYPELRNTVFYNIEIEDRIHQLLYDACRDVFVSGSDEGADRLLTEVSRLRVDSPWFAIIVNVEGESAGRPLRIVYTFRNNNSYEVTALMIGEVLKHCLDERPAPGVYWASECVEPVVAVQRIIESCSQVQISEDISELVVDEGIL
ncbi:MAG: saccharopine dehydrogenase NADP-binding domain-containing protein [Lachnospiraceae bacterium]